MAAPDPARRAPAVQGAQGDGLGIVHEHEVVLLLQPRRIALGGLAENVAAGLIQARLGALQGVVEPLGGLEEGLVPVNDLPVRHQPQVAQQRHHRAQQLGDAAAVGRGVDVQHPGAAQRAGPALQLVQGGVGGEPPVVIERLLADVHVFQHGVPAWL